MFARRQQAKTRVTSPFNRRVDSRALGTRYAHADVRGQPSPRARSSQRSQKRRRVVKIVAWLYRLAVFLAALHLLGVDVWGWSRSSGTRSRRSSIGYLILGCIFQAIQTTLTALGWYGILRHAYPGGAYMAVLASYAAGVALNNFLPANIGTFVTLVMYVAVVRRRDLPGHPRRLPRPEDLLPHRRDAHLPLPTSSRSQGRSTSRSGTSGTGVPAILLVLGIVIGAIWLDDPRLRLLGAGSRGVGEGASPGRDPG